MAREPPAKPASQPYFNIKESLIISAQTNFRTQPSGSDAFLRDAIGLGATPQGWIIICAQQIRRAKTTQRKKNWALVKILHVIIFLQKM